jgi:hypothetical protein
MSASLDHLGTFAEQSRREVYPLRDLHPALPDDVHRLFIAMWEASRIRSWSLRDHAWSQTERSPAAGLALSPAGQAF